MDSTFLNVTPGTNGNGGQIFLTGELIASNTTNPIILNVNGNGTGSGGRVSVTSTGNGNLTVGAGNATLHNSILQLSATGSSGGEVDVSAGGAFTVNPSFLNVTATGANGNGGIINLGRH